uniref:Integrase catalytic domain-containing protein n=2 Tax=Lygus hesperus TaxID=30085 RepID=A0A0A9XSD4_LYGHE
MVLDSGSQHSFVTNKCVQKLGFKPKPCSKTVSGIGQTFLHGLKGTISCIIRPLNHRSVQLSTEAIAVSSITNELPHSTIHSDFVNRCDSYHLADPNFWKPGPVEFLLGADLYYDVVNGAPLTIEDGQPKLTPTIFGHDVAGRAHGSNNSVSTSLFVESDLPTIINKFWEVESVQERPLTSEEGRKCEQHFAETHYRLPTGRYVVSLPLKTPDLDLSESRHQALTRFINLENKLLLSPCVTQDVPYDLDSELDNSVKILGLQYCPKQDAFMYHIDTPPKTLTKRAILSAISKIYDPLGYLAPVVFEAKTILQEAWLAKCDWDQQIPPTLAESWESFVDELHNLSQVRVPRWLRISEAKNIHVLGFCDASTKGYAAAVYLRLQLNQDVQCFLIKAKTKLAPTKPTTIPRLELNGALLLAKIVTSIQPFLKKIVVNEFHWFTDSTIVLGWLKTDPTLLKAYVAHRVVTINEAIQLSDWQHIRTEDNPVDCASRGLNPSELASHDLWWAGPQWLKLNSSEWPTLAGASSIEVPQDDPEMKKLRQSLLTRDAPLFMKMIERFSSYYRLLRSCAILRRFISWLTTKQENKKPISVSELQQSQTLIIIFVQSLHFSSDKSMEKLRTSKIGRLDPFLDPHGVVRVGGRLKNSHLSYQQKYPILLPGNCHFTRLLIDHYHEAYLHLSPSLLQNLIQNQFWILSARNTIKQRVHRCLKCFKSNPKPQPPVMGNLPASRFAETKPFINVGVDYGGPFLIRASLRRNAGVSKAYLSLFVCMSTKALHLELVSSGTTEAFMAALDRFIARRGKPAHIYSDNGRNFVGASRELKETVAWLNDEQKQRKIHQHLAIQEIDWSFNPPLTPHFGGLWEAGIKSAKAILKKAISPTPFTFEELSTIFARTEAILNSRPLCPLYSDPDSMDVLTPGHFLIGGPLIASPEVDLLDCRENALSRWQLVKQRVQHCWKRWRNEYLSTLQQRVKWLKPTRSVAVGDLVLLRDVNTPVSQWPTARVLEVHPGNDGIVRVVTVKTASSKYKRSVANVVSLDPILDSSSEQSSAAPDGCSGSPLDSSAPES